MGSVKWEVNTSLSQIFISDFRSKHDGVGRRGFEPLKSKDSGFTVRPIWPLWNLPLLPEFHLPFFNAHLNLKNHYLPLKQKKSQRRDSNPRPADYKSAALPAELLWLITFRCDDVPCHHHRFYKKQRTTRFFWEGKGNGNLEMQKFCCFIFKEEYTIRYVYALQGIFCGKFEGIPINLQSTET